MSTVQVYQPLETGNLDFLMCAKNTAVLSVLI